MFVFSIKNEDLHTYCLWKICSLYWNALYSCQFIYRRSRAICVVGSSQSKFLYNCNPKRHGIMIPKSPTPTFCYSCSVDLILTSSLDLTEISYYINEEIKHLNNHLSILRIVNVLPPIILYMTKTYHFTAVFYLTASEREKMIVIISQKKNKYAYSNIKY